MSRLHCVECPRCKSVGVGGHANFCLVCGLHGTMTLRFLSEAEAEAAEFIGIFRKGEVDEGAAH